MASENSSRKIILFIASSVDGFIAGPGDDLSFLKPYETADIDTGYPEFIATIDTVILGRKTYDKVLSFGIPFPHADKKTYVITRSERPDEGNITFWNDSLKKLGEHLKREEGKNIFCDGGAELVFGLMKENMIDEFIITLVPVMLGDGTPLFRAGHSFQQLELISTKAIGMGLVQLHYRKK